MKLWLPASILTCGWIALAGTPAYGQAASSQRDIESLLDSTITSSTKRTQSVRSVPATVVVLTADDLRDRGYTDLVDAMRDMPGVSFLDNALADAGGSMINFRGLPGNHNVALLLNGHRIMIADRSQLDAFFFLHTFPLAFVKRLEVVYGPGSALYGADAVSAVINVVTMDGAEAHGVTLGTSYGLRGTTSDHVGFGAQLDEDCSLMIGGRFFRTDGEDLERLPAFANSIKDRQYWPGSKTRDMSESSDFELFSYRNKGFALDFVRSASNAQSVGVGIDALYASNDKDRWIASTDSLTLDYTTALGELQCSTVLVFDVYTLNPNSNYFYNAKGDASSTDPGLRSAYANGYKFGMGRATHLEETLVQTFSPDLSLVGGAVVEDHNGIPQPPDLARPIDTTQGLEASELNWVQYQNYGLYCQVQLGYLPGLQTTLGGRFDYNTRYDPTFTPRLGLVYDLQPSTTLKASYATSYLAPEIGQVYQRWGVPGEYMGFPNTGLRPVRGQSSEVSVLHDLTADSRLTLTCFRNEFADLIAEEKVIGQLVDGKVTDGTRFANLDHGTMIGGDLRFDGRLATGLTAFASTSLLNATTTHTGGGAPDPVADSVAAILHFGLVYHPVSWLTIDPRVTWLSGRATTDENPVFKGAVIPGACLFDLAARVDVNDRLSLRLTGTNLLDWEYLGAGEFQLYSQGSSIPQIGRRLSAGLTYTF
ncbi:MAG: outer rane receptor protein [Cyanobacteria bacterium RYN_339]|nr:outer rane receptor protein [Cyanobacteria bacterium RYN_339]